MALEDWEKELRDQFGDVAVSIPAPSAPVPSPAKAPEAVVVPATGSKTNDSGTWMFMILLVILAVATLWVYDDKTGGKIKSMLLSTFHTKVSPAEKPLEERSDADVARLKAEIEKFKQENKTTLDAMQAKLNTNSTKIGLMGLLLNENFTMIMRGADANDFIFFNRDWTLDREPKYIELTEDDKEYLKKLVRPNQ